MRTGKTLCYKTGQIMCSLHLGNAEVDKLETSGIFALAVRFVESLYYCSDAM